MHMKSTQSSPLNGLLPELYPLIAAHLPLHSTPSTLLSLALVNHDISNIVLPLLPLRLVLRTETDAHKVIQSLLDEPQRGQIVLEIHVLTKLPVVIYSWQNLNPFVFTGLTELITTNSLPNIHTLGFRLHPAWFYPWNDLKPAWGFEKLLSNLKNCPRLHSFLLKDIADLEENLWINNCGLLEMQNITSLSLTSMNICDYNKLLKNIESLSADLLTLELKLNVDEWAFSSPLLGMTFPKLRSLTLDPVFILANTLTIAFFERHPSLEFLKIESTERKHWFARDSVLPPGFLPNLKHLRANFYDVQILTPILSQLVSMTIYHSIDSRIPYMPKLKSLYIAQKKDRIFRYYREGGTSREAKVDVYITRAPNLEEVGFDFLTQEAFAKVTTKLARLSKLRRLYYAGPKDEGPEAIVSRARTLAKACKGLAMIVNTNSVELPYLVARIRRTESGGVGSIEAGSGYGMQIGSEDKAFPT